MFATPNGKPASADPRMVTGDGLGIFKAVLKADKNGLKAYRELEQSPEFLKPISYEQMKSEDYQALLLPGGHAKGMKIYLESALVQSVTASFFEALKPVGAICHGTLVAGRSLSKRTGQSVLFGYKTTGLTKLQEMTAWSLTRGWLGNYYRTYPVPVETELKACLESRKDYLRGPLALARDAPTDLSPGFTVLDKNYLSARWPGDAHKFASEFVSLVQEFRS